MQHLPGLEGSRMSKAPSGAASSPIMAATLSSKAALTSLYLRSLQLSAAHTMLHVL